jgi:hypothetical protein
MQSGKQFDTQLSRQVPVATPSETQTLACWVLPQLSR